MNETSDNLAVPGNDAVEALLEKAKPRPSPPEAVEQEIRAAVRAEWINTGARRQRRRLAAGFAIAASVTLVLAVSILGVRQTGIAPVEVASIDRSVGTLHVQSDSAGAMESVDTTSVLTGQVLTTGADSAAGLSWLGGGSLRVDSDSRIEFVAANEVFLHSGRIYFDSFASGPDNDFSIHTTHGVVSHVGTQYMTESDAASLVVSVREGEVRVDGAFHDSTVHVGQRVQLSGSAQPSITNTSGAGGEWQWIEAVSPNISVDGMSVFDFLHWVGRETGHAVQFESASAEVLARGTQLRGAVNAEPRAELRLRMMTVDLDARFDPEGPVIIVTD
jgi:ferric-dicitrate binding protein FerR (iron transport regulator)